jgi:hypothetical protein
MTSHRLTLRRTIMPHTDHFIYGMGRLTFPPTPRYNRSREKRGDDHGDSNSPTTPNG